MKFKINAKDFRVLVARCIDEINKFSFGGEHDSSHDDIGFNFIEGGENVEQKLENILMQIINLMTIHKVVFSKVGVFDEPNGTVKVELEGKTGVSLKKIMTVKVVDAKKIANAFEAEIELRH